MRIEHKILSEIALPRIMPNLNLRRTMFCYCNFTVAKMADFYQISFRGASDEA